VSKPTQQDPQPPSTDTGAGSVLIVEDSYATAKIISKILAGEGYRTFLAGNGREALDVVEAEDPELVIADWMMPEMTGVELCRRIKDDPRRESIYVIILTSLAGRIEETLGETVRADDYMVKPFNKSEIVARVGSGMRVARLQRRLRTSLSELEHKQQELLVAEKMAAIGVLIAGIAHEINNPLAIVSNAHQLLERDFGKVLELLSYIEKLELPETIRSEVARHKHVCNFSFLQEDVADSLKYGFKGIDRISAIIKRLQIFQNSDFLEFEVRPVDAALEAALATLPPELLERSTLDKACNARQQVRCNLEQLTVVLVNLLTNACEAVKRTGGKIGLFTRDEPGTVVIEVTDNGYGMPEQVRQRVFDPFYTTKKVGSGLGLGLTTAYYLLKIHGAAVSIVSAPGRGTTVTMRFPAAD